MPGILKSLAKQVLSKGSFNSYSQFGEDAIINSLYRFKNNGTYLDIGAYHPHLYSNTYALYKRGWRGTIIDPNPDTARLFNFFRREDVVVTAAVGDGEIKYYSHKDAAYNGFTQNQASPLISTTEIACVPLSSLLTTPTDLLSIDCEGAEYDVLLSHDWGIYPETIIIETAPNSPAYELLIDKNYRLYGMSGLSLIFTNKHG